MTKSKSCWPKLEGSGEGAWDLLMCGKGSKDPKWTMKGCFKRCVAQCHWKAC